MLPTAAYYTSSSHSYTLLFHSSPSSEFYLLFKELGLYKTGAPKKNRSESNAADFATWFLKFALTLCPTNIDLLC